MGAAEVYRRTRKVPDLFWNAYVCRPIAAVFVSAVAKRAITPNQITLLAFLLALFSGLLLLGLPGYLGVVVAILVFEASYVLDCADGMLARLRNVQSTPGHLLDFLMDEIKAFVILAAVSVRLWMDRGHVSFLLIGILGLAALASGIALTTFQRRPEIAGEKRVEPKALPLEAEPAEEPAPAVRRSLLGRALGTVEAVAKLLIHYPSYILLVALSGHLEFYLYPYVAVNALYAGRAFLGVAVRFGGRAPQPDLD